MTLTQIDQRTMQWTADRLRTPWLTPVMRFFTFLGDWPTWIALIFVARLQNGWLWEVFGWVGWAWWQLLLALIAVRRRRPVSTADTDLVPSSKTPTLVFLRRIPAALGGCVPRSGMFHAGYGMGLGTARACFDDQSFAHLSGSPPSDVLGLEVASTGQWQRPIF